MSHSLTDVPGVGASTAEILIANNVDSVNKLAGIDIGELTRVPGIGKITGQKMIQAARGLLAADKTEKSGNPDKIDSQEKKEKKDKKKDKKKDRKSKKGKKGKNKKGKKNKK